MKAEIPVKKQLQLSRTDRMRFRVKEERGNELENNYEFKSIPNMQS